MSRGCSSKPYLGQVPNFLPKLYFYDKHGPLNPDVRVLADWFPVPLSGARRGSPAGLLRGLSMANNLACFNGIQGVPKQARFDELNRANDFLWSPSNEPGIRRHFSIEISAIARSIRQRRYRYRRSIQQTINRCGRHGSCEYFLKKFRHKYRLHSLTSLPIVEYINVFDFSCFA